MLSPSEVWHAWNLINNLRSEEMWSVMLFADNADDGERCGIMCTGAWITDVPAADHEVFPSKYFYGDTVYVCLKDAYQEMIVWREANRSGLVSEYLDDEVLEWTLDQWGRAEVSIGEEIITHGQGTLSKSGKRGRPKSLVTKRQTTLRLDADVLTAFRASGPNWSSRINAALRKAAGL